MSLLMSVARFKLILYKFLPACALMIGIMTAADSQAQSSGFSSINATEVNQSFTFTVSSTAATGTIYRFALFDASTGAPAPVDDSLANGGVQTVAGGVVNQLITLGNSFGVRRIQFCFDTPDPILKGQPVSGAKAVCDPTAATSIVAYLIVAQVSCAISAGSPVLVNQPFEYTTSCNVQVGPDASVVATNSTWNVTFTGSGTVNQPTTALPGPATGTVTPTVPGTFEINISPNIDLATRFTTSSRTIFAGFSRTPIGVAANASPTVSLSDPGSPFVVGRPVTLNATATDSDGAVESVNFVLSVNDQDPLVIEDTTAPYSYTFTPAAVGNVEISVTAIDNLGSDSSTDPITVPIVSVDNVAPTIALTAPADGAQLPINQDVAITADASDSDGTIVRVEFFANGVLLGEADDLPYSIGWTPTTAGDVTLTARATDNLGATTTSVARNVTVTTAISPVTVTLTSPISGANFPVGSTVALAADVSTSDPDIVVQRVEFYANGTLINTDTTRPFAFNWTPTAAGSVVLTARGVSFGGDIGDSSAITINVQAINQPPTANLTAPQANAQLRVNEVTTITATANDSDGSIDRVEFYVNDALLGSDTSAPYNFDWTPTQRGQQLISVIAVDDDDASSEASNATVTVINNTVPTISLTSPGSNAAVDLIAGTVLTANASDADGSIARVEFYGNGTLLGQSTTTPYTLNWKPDGPGNVELFARAVDNNGQAADSQTISVTARNVISDVRVLTPINQLVFTPGQQTRFVIALDTPTGGRSGMAINWQIRSAKATAKVDCVVEDVPNAGTGTTDPNGQVVIAFTPGCASAERQLSISPNDDPSKALTVALVGPDQRVDQINADLDADVLVVDAGVPSPVSVIVRDTAGNPLPGSTTQWTLIPASSGVLTPTAQSDAQGRAVSTLTLNANTPNPQVQVCIGILPDQTCATFAVTTKDQAIVQPAQAVTQPIATQTIETSRIHLSQIRNRMQQLRTDSGHGFSNQAGLRIAELRVDGSTFRGNDRNNAGNIGANNNNASEGSGGQSDGESGSDKGDGDSELDADGVVEKRAGVFVIGDVEVTKRKSDINSAGYRVGTRGMTVGADYRLKKDIVIGGAVGFAFGDTDIVNGEQSMRGWNGSVFGQWTPRSNWFINSIASTGKTDFDLERFALNGDRLTAETSSRQRSASIEAGYSFANKAFKFTPYGRYEYIDANVDGFREEGSMMAVEVSDLDISSRILALGGLAEWAISSDSGVWIPSFRLEYLDEDQDQSGLQARLINGNVGFIPIQADVLDSRYGNVGFSLQWLSSLRGHPISSFFTYDRTFGQKGISSQRAAIGVKVPF